MFSAYPIDLLHVNDNYAWTIVPDGSRSAYVVDPGDSQPVVKWLQDRNLELAGILITHRHWDHVNGIQGLIDHRQVPVWGPKLAALPQVTHSLGEGDTLALGPLKFHVMAVPGHTQEHIAYYTEDGSTPALFCGDTLFASGCGRVSDGAVEDLYLSLTRFAQLPAATLVYCAHEYTLANLAFAQTVEPHNADVRRRRDWVQQLRNGALPSPPSQLDDELATNPFLRCHVAEVAESASAHTGAALTDSVDVFAALRRWKDNFRSGERKVGATEEASRAYELDLTSGKIESFKK